jgi:hypothetical protein
MGTGYNNNGCGGAVQPSAYSSRVTVDVVR